MKNIFRISLMLAFTLFASCKKEEAPSLTVTPSTVDVATSSASTVSVSLKANNDWMVSSNAAWVHVSPTSGVAGSAQIQISVDENSQTDGRTASVTFSSANLSQTVTINQVQKNSLVIGSSLFELDDKAQEIEVRLSSNIDYTVEIPSEVKWIQSLGTKGMKDYTERFSIAANDTFDAREGKIIIRASGLSEEIVVKQAQNDSFIIVSDKYLDLPADKAEVTVELNSNVGCSVTVPEAYSKWIIANADTKGIETYKKSFTIMANDTYADRDGEIIFVAQTSGLADTVKVHQCENYGIILTKKIVEVPVSGGDIEVELKANLEYMLTIVEGSDWVSEIVETKALETYHHKFRVTASTIGQRTAKIEFRAKGTDICETLTVIQGKVDQTLSFTHSRKKGFLPKITADTISGTVDWGDGKSTKFSKDGMTHTYSDGKQTHTEIVTFQDAKGILFSTLSGISAIDISGF